MLFSVGLQYHPDSNADDKSLHEKFVKINEAFGVLGKAATRTNYDQSNSIVRRSDVHLSSLLRLRFSLPWFLSSPILFPSPFVSSPTRCFSLRLVKSPEQPPTSPEQQWIRLVSRCVFLFSLSDCTPCANSVGMRRGTPHYDKTFFDLLRRRMEQDRQRARNASANQGPPMGMMNNYFIPFSVISFLIGFGILIHTLKGRSDLFSLFEGIAIGSLSRMLQFDETNYARDPRSRNYHAYREWQRLSALRDAESIPMRERTKVVEEEEEDDDEWLRFVLSK